MSKWFEVKVTSLKVVAVQVEDDQDGEDALMYAIDGDSTFHDAEAKEVVPDQLEAVIRHADEVMRIGG